MKLKTLWMIGTLTFALLLSVGWTFAQDALTETITHEGVTVSYPEGWIGVVSTWGEITVANSQMSIDAPVAFPTTGLVIRVIVPSHAPNLNEAQISNSRTVIRAWLTELNLPDSLPVETFQTGNISGWVVDITQMSQHPDTSMQLITFDVDGATLSSIVTQSSRALPGVTERFLRILENISYSAESESDERFELDAITEFDVFVIRHPQAWTVVDAGTNALIINDKARGVAETADGSWPDDGIAISINAPSTLTSLFTNPTIDEVFVFFLNLYDYSVLTTEFATVAVGPHEAKIADLTGQLDVANAQVRWMVIQFQDGPITVIQTFIGPQVSLAGSDAVDALIASITVDETP